MLRKICLAVLIGLPASGKTTFCKNLKHIKNNINIFHICYDDELFDIDSCIFGKNVSSSSAHETRNSTFKTNRKKILNKINKIIESILKYGTVSEFFEKYAILKDNSHNVNEYVILIDDNNYYLGMRYEFYKLAREFEISYCQLYFPTDLETALLRNSLRTSSGKVPDVIINEMNKKLEPPLPERRKFEENTFGIDLNVTDYEALLNFLQNCLSKPVGAITKRIEVPIEHSLLHQIDLLLRKEIKNQLEMNKKNLNVVDIKILANQLNLKRKQILNHIKCNEIDINELDGKKDIIKILLE